MEQQVMHEKGAGLEGRMELHEHGNRAELECQNPAMNIVGKDGIRLEGKL